MSHRHSWSLLEVQGALGPGRYDRHRLFSFLLATGVLAGVIEIHLLVRTCNGPYRNKEIPMMSDRERWIVYPLLFLGIGFGLKSQWPQPDDLECRSIRCKEVIVDSLDGTSRVRVGSTSTQSGEIRLYGATGQLVLALGTDGTGTRGMVQTLDDQRNSRAVIGSDTAGGFVRLFGDPNIPSLFLGHDSRHKILGVLAMNEQGKPLVLSHKDRSVLWGLQVPLARAQTSGDQTEPGSDAKEDTATTEDGQSAEGERQADTTEADAEPDGDRQQSEEATSAETHSESEDGVPSDATTAETESENELQQPADEAPEVQRPNEPSPATVDEGNSPADEGSEQREAG